MKKYILLFVIQIAWNIVLVASEYISAQNNCSLVGSAFFKIGMIFGVSSLLIYFVVNIIRKNKYSQCKMCLGMGYFILLVLSLNQLSSEMELRIAVNIVLGIVGFMFYAIIPGDAECSLKKTLSARILHKAVILLSIVLVIIGNIDAFTNHNLNDTEKIRTVVLCAVLLTTSVYYFVVKDKRAGKLHLVTSFLGSVSLFTPFIEVAIVLCLTNVILVFHKKLTIFEDNIVEESQLYLH